MLKLIETEPRLNPYLVHCSTQEKAFLEALELQRLHHAWLLSGPQGLGKATYAYCCARYLLARNHDVSYGPLGVSPAESEARLMAALSHPDLMTITKDVGEGGKLKKNISVDAIREIGQFFSLAPSRSKYRVCIIDSVDDLNINSSNALLKILEEPPKNGVIFLVSHSPGKLLSTIKSRCRRLVFTPWSDRQVFDFLKQFIDINNENISRLVSLAKGAPGKALNLYKEDALEFDTLAANILLRKDIPDSEITKMAGQFRLNNNRINGIQNFGIFIFCLMDQIHNMSLNGTTLKQGARLAELWQYIGDLSLKQDLINLDRGDIFINIYNELKSLN